MGTGVLTGVVEWRYPDGELAEVADVNVVIPLAVDKVVATVVLGRRPEIPSEVKCSYVRDVDCTAPTGPFEVVRGKAYDVG